MFENNDYFLPRTQNTKQFKVYVRELVTFIILCSHKTLLEDFPGGAVVKNLPANAGDTGSIPDPGRSYMPQSNEAPGPQLLSLRSRATSYNC